MGRKKIDEIKKKKSLTVNLPNELFSELKEREIKNKSKLFQWLLEEYFNEINKR